MDNYQDLKYKLIKAAENSDDAYTLLLLHGTGGDENDLIPLAKNFGSQLNILSVRGNVLEQGMPRFFKRLGMGVFDEKDLVFRTEELVFFLKKISGEQALNPEKMIALGYSNGANIAGGMLMLYPDFLKAAILFRPMLPLKDKTEFPTASATPVFMTSGASDPTVNVLDSKNWEYLLSRNKFEVTHEVLSTGHQLTEQDVTLAVEWLKKKI